MGDTLGLGCYRRGEEGWLAGGRLGGWMTHAVLAVCGRGCNDGLPVLVGSYRGTQATATLPCNTQASSHCQGLLEQYRTVSIFVPGVEV